MKRDDWTEDQIRSLAMALKKQHDQRGNNSEEHWSEHARLLIKRASNAGIHIDVPGSPDYPTHRLSSLGRLPVLFRKGAPVSYDRGVAVVGSRDADIYGLSVTRIFSRYLASKNIAIISGGARGVDAQAHRTALEGGGKTVAVLAGGLDRLSPASSRKVFSDILRQGGTLLSESPPGEKAKPYFFPKRNRLVVALSDVVLVTQAAKKSGCISTAEAARKLEKPLFVVPGDICYFNSEGVNQLLMHPWVRPALRPDTWMGSLGWLTGDRAEEDPRPGHRKGWLPPHWQRESKKEVTFVEQDMDRHVLEILSGDPLSPSEVSVRCHIPMNEVMISLGRLEMVGRVSRVPGNRYVSI